jgi:eukaryotic-like serine/threonine-protein kinase
VDVAKEQVAATGFDRKSSVLASGRQARLRIGAIFSASFSRRSTFLPVGSSMAAEDSHSTSVAGASQGEEAWWDILAERIDAFAAAWDGAVQLPGGQLPRIDEFVGGLDESTARQVLLELAKLDIERRWQENCQPQHIEWYVQQFPALGPLAKLPSDLIYEELQARMAAGLPIYQEELQHRFPMQCQSLLKLVGGMAISGSPTATYFAETVVEKAGAKSEPKPKATFAAFTHLKPGDQLDDFQLLTPLGSGAFARVFLARQVSMERLVALKISAHTGSEPQTLAQLDHPHIVRVYDQRACADPPARLLYMEVVSGGTLQDVIARARNSYDGKASGPLLLSAIDERLSACGAPIPESSSSRDWIEESDWPEVVCRLGAELCEGLDYAHDRGVLHRDIKPANVLLSAEGRPKLADFNVSYNGGRSDENPEDTFGGSLAYMSPEQLEACHPLLGGSPRLVRETSDVYAVGVMLWELLAGRRPFRDEQLPSGGNGSLVRLQRMIESRRNVKFHQLAEQLPDECPESLLGVLEKALSPAKEDRYQTAGQMARALRMCLNPRCWRLLQEPRGWFGRFVTKHPVPAVVLAGLIPNIITAAFNFLYNQHRFETDPELTGLYDRFMVVQEWVNGIAFPVGISVGVWGVLRIIRLLRNDNPGDAMRGATKLFEFGQFVAILLLTIWSVSGITFPLAIGEIGGHSISFYLHFFLSLAICGIAATTYPYMLITALAVRYFVPSLIRRGLIPGPRRVDLLATTRRNKFYLMASILVPMLGIWMVLAFVSEEAFGDERELVLLTVSGGGTVGFLLMILLERMIGLDLAALGELAVEEPRASGSMRSSRGSVRRSRGASKRSKR